MSTQQPTINTQLVPFVLPAFSSDEDSEWMVVKDGDHVASTIQPLSTSEEESATSIWTWTDLLRFRKARAPLVPSVPLVPLAPGKSDSIEEEVEEAPGKSDSMEEGVEELKEPIPPYEEWKPSRLRERPSPWAFYMPKVKRRRRRGRKGARTTSK